MQPTRYTWKDYFIIIEDEYRYLLPRQIDIWGHIHHKGNQKDRHRFVATKKGTAISYKEALPEGMPAALMKLHEKRLKAFKNERKEPKK